jgi:hypothetical protein
MIGASPQSRRTHRSPRQTAPGAQATSPLVVLPALPAPVPPTVPLPVLVPEPVVPAAAPEPVAFPAPVPELAPATTPVPPALVVEPLASRMSEVCGLEQPAETPHAMMSQPDRFKRAAPVLKSGDSLLCRGADSVRSTHLRKKKGNAMQAQGGRGDRPRSNASRLPDASTEEKVRRNARLKRRGGTELQSNTLRLAPNL